MLWLSSDSNTSCSRRRHHRPRPSSSLSSSSSSSSLSSYSSSRVSSGGSGGVSYFLDGTAAASWRTPRRQTPPGLSSAIGVLLPTTSTVLVRTVLLVCALFVMILRCEQPPLSAAGRPPNGSDWKGLIRHSFLNQTGLRGGRWHPPGARPSPSLSRLSSGRARHRHQPYLPWFDSSHTSMNSLHGTDEDHPYGLPATGDVTTSGPKDSLADIVLPRQMVSKPGATYNLPHNATTLNGGQSEKDRVSTDATGTTTSPNGLVSAKVVAGMNFTLTRRLLKHDFVGNLVSDKNLSVNPSETLPRQPECLILDSYVILRFCSQLNSSLDRLSFQFCTHLRVVDAVDPIDRRRQLNYGMAEEDCRQCLSDLYDKDNEAQFMYQRFDDALFKYDCEDPYSTEWNCTDCKVAYRHWVCSATIPHYRNKKPADPCSHYSEMVENRCPYLSPHSQFQYAGEPVFLSTESLTSSNEMQLRSCHFLCQDRSINPQTEEEETDYTIDNSQYPSYCNTADLCYLPAEDNYELMQTNESNFISTFPLAVSVDRDRPTGLPDNTLQPADHSRTFLELEIESEESETEGIPSLMSNSSPLESKQLASLGILCIPLLVSSRIVLL